MTDLAGLIERLEKASEGSLALDNAINATLAKPYVHLPVPHWTCSLDAALTLVPEGFYLDLHDWRWSEEPRWHASLQNVTGLPVRASAKATTAPLALCIAALKARSQS